MEEDIIKITNEYYACDVVKYLGENSATIQLIKVIAKGLTKLGYKKENK